jgi:hypothetical protein
MAVRSQLALAKFLGHFFIPAFYAKAVYNKKGARRSERPIAVRQKESGPGLGRSTAFARITKWQ